MFEAIAARLGANAAKAEDHDEDEKKDDEKEARSNAKNEDDERDDKEDAKAEEPKEEPEEEDAEKKGKAKGKKKADDGDDEPEARGARRERARIREIINSKEADASNESLLFALDIALNTDQPVSSALVALRAHNRSMKAVAETMKAATAAAAAAGTSQRKALQERMADTPNPPVDADAAIDAPTLAQQIIAAGKKRRGEI